jgi:HCOMODA/2-hydroxy-3-carboxy-muconic semialdehyde decarboxylase
MSMASASQDLSLSNRILANEGVMDAFGHVSMRHPDDPQKFLLSRSLPPSLVQAEDILCFYLDSRPEKPTEVPLYAERVIHGEIYKARPDVTAVCHYHAPAVLAFCLSGRKLVPVSQMGAVLGKEVPFWDSHDDFGDTDLLVVRAEEGQSLAKRLGPNWTVLMSRHGATTVGTTLREMTFRAINTVGNAQSQLLALSLGQCDQLTPGEIERAGSLKPMAIERAWQYWISRLR